jgi:hypothetical protein
MNFCRDTAKMAVPPGNRRVLVPRRTWTVRRGSRQPRTPGRTAISVVAAGDSWNIRVAETKGYESPSTRSKSTVSDH